MSVVRLHDILAVPEWHRAKPSQLLQRFQAGLLFTCVIPAANPKSSSSRDRDSRINRRDDREYTFAGPKNLRDGLR